MKRRVLAASIAGMLVLGALTGCSGSSQNDGQSAPGKTETPADETADAPADAEAETPSKTQPDQDIVIAGIYKNGDQQWFIGEGAAAEEKVKEMGASEFMYIDVKLNPDTYLQALDNAITQGVSGILVCVPDQNLSKVTMQKCEEAQIPVVACDDPLLDENGDFIAPFVGIDALAIGQACGEWSAGYAKENNLTGEDCGVLYLTANTISSCVPRTTGAKEKFEEALPDWPAERVFEADYDGSQEKGYNGAATIFTANPQIKNWIIMAINDEGAAGATRALEEAGLDSNSVVCGIGGYLAKLEYQKEVPSAFKATAFINYVDVGAISAEELMNYILDGTEIPMDTRTPATIVTAENYKEVMKDQAE